MKIGVIQATSQTKKNELLYHYTVKSAEKHRYEVINFGCYEDESCHFSYIEIAVMISMLLSSKSIDFIVTGCSSGQGMMLACNSLPDVICGYVENPQDAFLFGRINDGNAVSIPLGLNFGWAGEINLQCTLEKLFEDEFGIGYPPEDADRKKQDTLLLKEINALTKRNAIDVFEQLDKALIQKVLQKTNVVEYILEYGRDKEIFEFIRSKNKF
ncbi:MAG: RpiB/LacA/LacB family sugar-phosphate isomerase [Lachnospiraceae bacterium]|nr:RpiB/LacA/LacB family sugar-phosphate isomerase [Lachnospiraceae bacterium]